MKCEFSEMQFTFGILHELVTFWTPKKAWSAPTLPTQNKERELGYDCKISGPIKTLYFQFKVPEKKTTKKAKHWPDFDIPYFQFEIWPDNITHQHNKLRDLSKDLHNKVYYCSPYFNTQKEFEEHYNNKNIAKKSIFIPFNPHNLMLKSNDLLQEINGDEKHSICYTIEPTKKHKMYSQEYSIEAFDMEGFIKDAEYATPYENISECLSKIEEIFSIQIQNRDNTMERFYEISNHLLMKENLNLLLLGTNQHIG